MAKLIAYASEKARRCADGKKDSRTKYNQCAKSLTAYLGPERDIDLLEIAAPGWCDAYYHYLSTEYSANKDLSFPPEELAAMRRRRAADHIRTLRRLCFNAVEEGLLPNIDFLADMRSLSMSRSKNIISPRISAEVDALIKGGDTRCTGAISRYLLSLCFGGAPIETLPQIIEQIDADTSAVTLPHLGIAMPLSPRLRDRVLSFRRRYPELHCTTQMVTTAFRMMDVGLMRSSDPFVDWLSLAQQAASAPDSLLKQLLQCRLAEAKQSSAVIAADFAGCALKIIDYILSRIEQQTQKHYYAVKVYGTTAQQEIENLRRSDSPVSRLVAGNVWCPCQWSKPQTSIERMVARRGRLMEERRAVMRDLFFVLLTEEQVATLDQAVANLWVFQTRDGLERKYSRIPARELMLMQRILEQIDDKNDIEFCLADSTAPEAHDFEPEERVKLCLPGFEECEAYVTKKISVPAGSVSAAVGGPGALAGPVRRNVTYRLSILTPDGKRMEMSVSPSSIQSLTTDHR